MQNCDYETKLSDRYIPLAVSAILSYAVEFPTSETKLYFQLVGAN
ncbi:MAG: hypothetical protein AAGE84_12470 [Cyanobacteria bacterium P01_G01_bin.39]